MGVQGFQGGPETRIVRGLDLKYEFLPFFHHLNTSAIITFSIFTAAILSMPTTLLPNNIAIFPTWFSSVNSSNHMSEPSMSPTLTIDSVSPTQIHRRALESAAHPLLPPYHIAHIYLLHRAHISSCQQTSLLCLTSS